MPSRSDVSANGSFSPAASALTVDRMHQTQTSDAKAVLTAYVAAVEAGDADAIRESFADDATWTLAGELPISGTWIGRAAIVEEFLPTALAHYEPGSVRLEITGMIAEGDHVALQWTSRARTLAGSAYENDCIGVFTVRDGRIRAVREYMDTHYAYRALAARRPRVSPA